jgi:hypothetical protein
LSRRGKRSAPARDGLHILAVEAVNWPDAALGCPQPDMIYAAVITPGYRVVIATADAPICRPHRQPDRRRADSSVRRSDALMLMLLPAAQPFYISRRRFEEISCRGHR